MKTNTSYQYSICDSRTGEELKRCNLPADRVENLSSDSPEGHFWADQLDELKELGHRSVYAILL